MKSWWKDFYQGEFKQILLDTKQFNPELTLSFLQRMLYLKDGYLKGGYLEMCLKGMFGQQGAGHESSCKDGTLEGDTKEI